MNETAKKLREAANYMAGSGANSAHAIATVRGLFDVVESDTFGEDLGGVLDVIADELDELQARAAGANNLRQQLESVEDKAERRKKQVEYTEDAIRERNARLKRRGEQIAELWAEVGKLRKQLELRDGQVESAEESLRTYASQLLERGERIGELTSEVSELRKQAPSERECQILDMWPRYEGGEPVWFGDSVEHDGTMEAVQGFKLYRCGPAYLSVVGIDTEKWLRIEDYKSVKRPAPKVLDADGVEIKAGDTVWHEDGSEQLVEEMNRYGVRCFDGDKRRTFDPKYLTHTRPDSWELLEENAADLDDMPCDFNAKDLIRRAKALAGVEVDE